MDELAQFYVQFFNATEPVTLPGNTQPTTLGSRVMLISQMHTVGVAEGLSTTQIDTSYLTTPWPSTTKTIPTVYNGGMIECPLCNEIFLFPAAKLIRLISTVPSGNRTTNMTSFVSAYTPFLVNDQVLRYIYNYQVPLGTCAPYMPGLANPTSTYDAWNYQTANYGNRSNSNLECFAMFNNHLYLIGMAAEILGANANDPSLVPLTSCSDPTKNPLGACQVQNLSNAVKSAVALFKKKQNSHPTTNFAGQPASAISYFDGDLVALSNQLLADSAYACYSTSSYPTTPCNPPGSPTNPDPLVSWDNSHYYIVPLFLRTLFDNKKVIGSLTGNFPSSSDLNWAAHQLIYNVMHNHTQASGQKNPVFSNYMDGTDGWYRVGYNGTGSGYAPSNYCDARAVNPPTNISTGPWICVASPGVTMGWGILSGFSNDLNQIQQNFASLAQATDSANQNFRDLHYFDSNRNLPFSFTDSTGQNVIYPTGLLNILFLNAAQIQ